MESHYDNAMNAVNIEDWVHEFLNGQGNNKSLSRIMKSNGRLYGPAELQLSGLERIFGPEFKDKFHEDEIIFEERITKMMNSINGGWQAPPLIAWKYVDKMTIADGCHRYEALKRCGYQKYWVIVWEKDELTLYTDKKII